MSQDDRRAALVIGMNSEESAKFHRLNKQILAILQANGGSTIALCGVVDLGGVRTVELFGRVRITAEAFVSGSDREVLGLIELKDLQARRSITEDTAERKRLSE